MAEKAKAHEIKPTKFSGAGSAADKEVTVKQATAALAAFRRHKGFAQPVKAMTEAIKAARG